MPQTYKRKTNRRNDGDILQCAKRYIDKQKDGSPGVSGHKNCKRVNMIFPFHMDTKLTRHVKQLAAWLVKRKVSHADI